MLDNNKILEIPDRKFMDYFGMTVDQFGALDIDTQEVLIAKVQKLRKKQQKYAKKIKLKQKLIEIFSKNKEKSLKR